MMYTEDLQDPQQDNSNESSPWQHLSCYWLYNLNEPLTSPSGHHAGTGSANRKEWNIKNGWQGPHLRLLSRP